MNYLGEAKDTSMWNPLHIAVYTGHFEVVKTLTE
jgi:ankyrin repeat protein